MASSSEDQRTLCPSIKPYHVFLSHRGPDTKKTLASFIYHSLSESGMNVFFDKREFVPGQELPSTIDSAISFSSVQIAILSPRYAESHWCLEELNLMQKTVESGDAQIIPVFCDVRPRDVDEPQNNEGIYAESFGELEQKMNGREKRFKRTKIEEWKKAVYEVSTSPRPLVLYEFKEDLGKLAVAVCERVMYHLGRKRDVGSDRQEKPSFLKPYNVFISHHGPDTKNTLASFIYHSFSERGVNVFINTQEFVGGEDMPSSISEAISTSSVRIAILSPKYAESHWCLEELHLMQNTSATFIPVFYEVPPGNLLQLRNNKGIYEKAFRELERKLGSDRIVKWKEALFKVSNISGFFFSEKFDRDMGELAAAVCSEVMKHLRRVWKRTADGFLGLEKAIDDFKNFLDVKREQSEKVKIVGIVGTPGCGKTTLAEEFYYRHRISFDRSSLLIGVRESSKKNGLPTLQSQLLKELTNDCLAISNVSEGKEIIADRVRRLCCTKSWKFLIVIDDVDHHHQLQALLRAEDVLGSDSLVIVTARNRAVLKLSGISLFYEIDPMSSKDAEKLLRRTAFHQSESTNGFDDLIQTALRKCGCFPEFLRCLGGNLHLYGINEKQKWEVELQMMMPEIFKAICGDLEEEERQIFLDIACFFEKMDKNSAIRVWDGFGWRGARVLQKLEYMCLVECDETTNCLSIPDYLRGLGQEIADRQLHNAPDLPFRLWRPNAARNFLKEPLLQAGAKIRGTRQASHKQQSKIELLDVSGDIPRATFVNRLKKLLWLRWENCPLKKLIWLRWENCPETASFPPEMNTLRVLELIKGNLRTLDLCLKGAAGGGSTPHTFQLTPRS